MWRVGWAPAVLGQEAGYTVDSSLVYRRATTKRSFTLTFTPVGNLESPVKLTLLHPTELFGKCTMIQHMNHDTLLFLGVF